MHGKMVMAARETRHKPSLTLRLLRLAGALWTSPNTMIGLLPGLCCLPFGARMQWRGADLALTFVRVPWRGAGGAITFGNVILCTGDELDTLCHTYAHRAGHGAEPLVSLAAHERAHVYQYMLLGPLFLPLYALGGGVSARNPFERAADRYARDGGVAWWPWIKAGSAPPG
jgi:hypothetical protein